MTPMIPATIHSSVQSTAEKRIFEVIRDAPNIFLECDELGCEGVVE